MFPYNTKGSLLSCVFTTHSVFFNLILLKIKLFCFKIITINLLLEKLELLKKKIYLSNNNFLIETHPTGIKCTGIFFLEN
jgi:hypothetical protein